MKYEDIVFGDFCAPYVKNEDAWLFPGKVWEKSQLRANELAKRYAQLMKKNS